MKPVLFVIHQAGAQADGGVQSVGELMRRLKDHRSLVLTNIDSPATRSWRDAGIEVHVSREDASRGLASNPIGTLRTYVRYHRVVRDLLAKSGARIVHANDPLAFQLSYFAARRAGAKLALNLRDTIDPERRPPRLKFRAIFGAADHVFYLSHDMAERWRLVAPNAMRAHSVTYSIVDPERFSPSTPENSEPPVVLVPGIFRAKKGQLGFIRNVVPALASKGIETWFAGDFDPSANAYAADCAIAAEPHSDFVRFLGYRADLPELLRRAAVVAAPSKHEGLMRGMIEAMSGGRPVVSFDVCSAREVLEDSGAGTVVEQGDYEGMAAALLRFATDPRARSAAGQAGSAQACKLFDADRVVECYERVYRELVEV